MRVACPAFSGCRALSRVTGRTITESRNEDSEVAGRWPPNLLLTHSADCVPAGTRRVKGITGGTGKPRRLGVWGTV